MSDDGLTGQLREAAARSPEDLAALLFDLISSPRAATGGKDAPPEVFLLRTLISSDLDDLRPQLSIALSIAAATWSFGSFQAPSAYIGMSLFAHFSSPSIATCVAVRLRAPSNQANKLRGDGLFDDLLIGTVMGALYDPVVRAHMVELLRLPNYRRFAITAMIRLIKYDLSSISTVSQIALRVAQERLDADPQGSSYMVGFDAELTAGEILNIVKNIPRVAVARFIELFILRSSRFVELPHELRSLYPATSRRGTTVIDTETGASVWIPLSGERANSYRRSWAHVRAQTLSDLQAMGLKGKPLAA